MPKSILQAFLKQVVFWILFFETGQLLFLIYHYEKLSGIPLTEILSGFFYSLPLNIAMTSYFMIIPWVIWLIGSIIPFKKSQPVIFIYTSVIICVCSLITCSELEIYDQWGTKLSSKALSYLNQPVEIFSSVSSKIFFLLLLLSILFSSAGIIIYRKYFSSEQIQFKKNILFSVLFGIFTPGLIFLGMRGGFKPIPVNQSSAYFSKFNVLNAAAVNPEWNLLQSIDQNRKNMNKNPFMRMPVHEALSIVDSLFHVEKDTTVYFLSAEKPNVVFIILEGFSADNMVSLGGYPTAAKNLDKLAQDGFLFTNIYATGDRSEQGMAAIFSGFPAQPLASILRQPDKFQKLPSLVRSFSENGYHTSFYFGGQLSYGNIEAYLITNGIEKIVELSDFNSKLPHGKLGVHDEFLFDRTLSELDKMKSPFFASVFTQSTHSPFDLPKPMVNYSWTKNENSYINGVMYSDSCIGNFMEEAKRHPWYKNTLFVFIADHSHATPREHDFFSPENRKIPLLFYGDVLLPSFRGMKCRTVASQIDLSSSILAQLNFPHEKYRWSKNLMNPYTKPFAFMAFLDGSTGWVQDSSNYFAYNLSIFRFYQNTFSDSLSRKKMIFSEKAFLQTMFREYLSY